MRPLIDIAIAIVIAAGIGLSTAWLAVERGNIFGLVRIGDWTASPEAGSPGADPYAVARLARTGELPLGAGEGLAFTVSVDADGDPLAGNCTYHIDGQTPAARLWTLTAYDQDGRLMANAAQRQGFHSREILRRTDGSFDIVVSPDVQPGNWLPIAGAERFKLVLRLYDTPLTTGTPADSTMPDVRREQCR
ncbi:DUF1214 domain-containing protein [Bauldia litoralis]|uniref:DUF1214 domain-containing protein n=1 Tax=Bauldia litoralis TaxID=665467 RepID=A0A1G6CEG2_9HYPH|nr:DUF1214 domain-containing protein [Bauldia litoralis]SDB31294.1 hypothetical protein SAMN02982931_02387 [Bauldia litoralis]